MAATHRSASLRNTSRRRDRLDARNPAASCSSRAANRCQATTTIQSGRFRASRKTSSEVRAESETLQAAFRRSASALQRRAFSSSERFSRLSRRRSARRALASSESLSASASRSSMVMSGLYRQDARFAPRRQHHQHRAQQDLHVEAHPLPDRGAARVVLELEHRPSRGRLDEECRDREHRRQRHERHERRRRVDEVGDADLLAPADLLLARECFDNRDGEDDIIHDPGLALLFR